MKLKLSIILSMTIIYGCMTIFIGNCLGYSWSRRDVSTTTFESVMTASTTMRMAQSDLETEVRFLLQDTNATNQTWTDAQLDRLLNEGQNQVCALIEPIEKIFKVTLETATTEYTLPPHIIHIKRVTWLDQGDAKTQREELTEQTIKRLDKDYEGWEDDSASDPTEYYVRGDMMGFYPAIGSTGVVWVEATVKPDRLEADTDYPFNDEPHMRAWHSVLVLYVVYRCYQQDARSGNQAMLAMAAHYREEYWRMLENMKNVIRAKPNYESSIRSRTK